MEIITSIFEEAPTYVQNILLLVIAALSGWIISFGIFKGVKILLNGIPEASGKLIDEKFRRVLQLLFTIISLNIALPLTTTSSNTEYYIHKIFYGLLIMSFALLLIKVTEFVKSLLYIQFDINSKDNLDERKARTQIDFLQKLSTVIILFIACAIILMSITRVRELGTSILASAGIAGIIIGLAAQRSIANLLAGFQIAFTQPIRLDDVVVVENEWGKIEEITLTYVVVHIWDNRRLVLPISYFLEKPFQNWTRVSSDILGTVFIYTDYSIPVNDLRKELARILSQEGKAMWDGKAGMIQVTNTSAQGIELRLLVSSLNASLNWDLRCLVREQMISFINSNFPEALPKLRLGKQLEAKI
jgi:small-conductance mechanosensitive channel